MLIVADQRWLFVCSANLQRSPTAEYVARKRGFLATSCGTSRRFSEGLVCVQISEALIDWCTIIVCMEARHVDDVARFPNSRGKPVENWAIEDRYGVYEPELIALCESRITETLKKYRWSG